MTDGNPSWKIIAPDAGLCICLPATHRRYDDEIFEHALRDFPEFAEAPHTSLVKLDEDWMKSKECKERWRSFINACVSPLPLPFARELNYKSRGHVHRYEKKITDFNFGSLIRTDATKEYSELNTIFGALVTHPV